MQINDCIKIKEETERISYKMNNFYSQRNLRQSSEVFTQNVQRASECYVQSIEREFERLKEDNRRLQNENDILKHHLNNSKTALEKKRAELNASLNITQRNNQSLMERNRFLLDDSAKKMQKNLELNSKIMDMEHRIHYLQVEKDNSQRLVEENRILSNRCDDLLLSNDHLKAARDELHRYTNDFITCFEEFSKNLRIHNIDSTDFNRGFGIYEKIVMYSKEFDVILNGITRNEKLANEEIKNLKEVNQHLKSKIEKCKKIIDEDSDNSTKLDDDEISGCKRSKRSRKAKNKIIDDSD